MHNRSGSSARWIARVGGVLSALVLAACGGGGGGGSGPAPTGTLQMSMTDAPACYESVVVNVARVRVHVSDDSGTADADAGWRDIVPPNAPVQIDLLNLTNGRLADLGRTTLPAGKYHQLRLVLANNGNTVTPIGGQPEPLTTPSGQQSGLKIKADFDVLANQLNDVLMDFDACKSIVLTGNGKYLLKPVVRLSLKPTGTIQGFVTTTVSLGGTATATLGSIGVSAQQDGAVVRSTTPDSNGMFTLAYLPSGTYTVVITGDGASTGAATRVVDGVPVAASTVSLNTSTSTIALSASDMRTVTGTITPSTTVTTTTLAENAMVSAMQTVNTRLVEAAGTVPDLTLAYSLRVPAAAPEYQPFTILGGLATPVTVPLAAPQYNIRVWGTGVPTKQAPADITSGPAVVDFAY